MDNAPDDRWVWRPPRTLKAAIALTAAGLAYASMALAPTIQGAQPLIGTLLFFLASGLIALAFFVLSWLRTQRPGRALYIGTASYLGVGLAGIAWMLFFTDGMAHPGHLGEGLLVWVAWPTMWLWYFGCELPVLSACLN